jgi:hypothetical protein
MATPSFVFAEDLEVPLLTVDLQYEGNRPTADLTVFDIGLVATGKIQ